MSEITEHELQALEMKKDEAIYAAGQEILRLKLLLSDLIDKAEPITEAVEYIDQMGPTMRAQYFGSMTCTNKFTEGDLRALSDSVRKAKETVGNGE